MIAAPLHACETERLALLNSYHILDTEPDSAFDAVTALASYISGAPMALITLVDHSRQWFKSRFDFLPTETSRDVSFCSHVILQEELFIVHDTLHDDRFRDNPLVTQSPEIRFYAGVPLVMKEGLAFGTLCVIDTKPRTLDPAQLEALRKLARTVVSLLELHQKNYALTEALENLTAANNRIAEQQVLIAYSAKMAALGEISASLAHEINNPLAIVIGHSNLLKTECEMLSIQAPTLARKADSIIKSCNRIAAIIKGLLAFARSSDTDALTWVSLDRILSDVLALSEQRIQADGTTLTLLPWPAGLELKCRHSGVTEVLLNLLSNARDAVLLGTKQTIEIGATFNNGRARIWVADSGPGVAPNLREKIMTPFFTTKVAGHGTGLGLSISKRIVEAMNGRLEIASDAPQTTFAFYLDARIAPLTMAEI